MDENRVNFTIVLHAHQPTGNFDFVFRESFEKCYLPLLEMVEKHPRIPIGLHYSGILFEWLADNEPAYLDRLHALVSRGQVEILGSGFGEPILVMLSDRDRRRQIDAMSEFVKERFGESPKGAWLTERVWEQSLAHDLASAGMGYTLVDDSHLKVCGIRGDDLNLSYVTEDRGSTIRIFPLSEQLRYLIPFQKVGDTIDYLRSQADREGSRLLVYGDDAEKFGSWPGTHQHVFQEGWLENFLTALEENLSWINLIRPRDALQLPPAGKIYIPDASYREMTEWALPTEARREQVELNGRLGEIADQAAPFFRGGTWRTFLSKYPESSEMYGRSMDVSRRIAELPDSCSTKRDAEMELFRGQCNCAYWHGVFGGLYLPHLRFAIYQKLVSAETILEKALHKGVWAACREGDFALDGTTTYQLGSSKLGLVIHPRRGGHLVELDDRERGINLSAGMTRRPEAYHDQLRDFIAGGDHGDGDDVASIHDKVVVKEEGLEDLLLYDDHKRESLVDRFFERGTTVESIASGDRSVEKGDFLEGVFEAESRDEKGVTRLILTRMGVVGDGENRIPVEIKKDIVLRGGETEYKVKYKVSNRGDHPLETMFGVEFNMALLAGDAHDRRLFDESGDIGPLASCHQLTASRLIGARDEYLGLSTGLLLPREGEAWIFPVKTVSLSEGGFESVYQSTVLLPFWEMTLDPGESREIEIRHFVIPAGEETRLRS